MKITKTVEFTPEEKLAIRVISDIDCKDIKCSECPFNRDNTCVRNNIRDIFNEIALIRRT